MIAVCTMAWNGIDLSRRWLDSVRRNSGGHDVKLFLLDNGSTDGTLDLFRSHGPEFLHRHEENFGIYKGWNLLFREAAARSPEAVVLANNDVIAGPRWLDALVREVRRPGLRYFLPNSDPGTYGDGYDGEIAAALPSLPAATVPARAGWCLMMRPEAVNVFLPIPESLTLWYGDDWMHHRLKEAGYACEAILDCCCKHAVSATVFRRPDFSEVVERDKRVIQEILGWLPQ